MKIISLGTNCEVSFFIEQFTARRLDSYISSWARMNFDSINSLDIFYHLDKILDTTWTLLPWGMVKHDVFNIGFHTKKTKEELFDENSVVNKSVYAEALEELQSRLKHLCEKTQNLFDQCEEDLLFVCKIDENYEDTLLYLAKLSRILKDKVKKANYVLLALTPGGKAEQLNAAAIGKNLLVKDVAFLQSPPIKKRGGFDLPNWQEAFAAAINKLAENKIKKFDINLLEDAKIETVKSGEATGCFDSVTNVLECHSEDHSYFGITYDVPFSALENKKVCLHLSIDDINSSRRDIGYVQFWENSKEKPTTYSALLENIYTDKTDYMIWYTIPHDLTRFRVVVQAKNGAFRIKGIALKLSCLV